MPRFLTRLEQTTDAPLDMRKPIKKALKKASSALDIRMTPPRYPAPRLRRKNRVPQSQQKLYTIQIQIQGQKQRQIVILIIMIQNQLVQIRQIQRCINH